MRRQRAEYDNALTTLQRSSYCEKPKYATEIESECWTSAQTFRPS